MSVSAKLSFEERTALADNLRRTLAAAWPREIVRASYTDPRKLKALWTRLEEEQSITSIGREFGALAEAAVVASALGYAACPTPFIGAYAARRVLDLAPGTATAIAFDDAMNVVDHLGATHLFVLAQDGAALWDLQSAEVTSSPVFGEPWLASIRTKGKVSAHRTLDPHAVNDIRLLVRLLLLSRGLGAAQRSFELAVEHARTREQFGQPVGRFQALQHKLANAAIDLDGVRLTLDCAIQAYDRQDASWRAFALAAVAFSSPALRRVTNESHHTLGAIGYSEEHEATLHFRRVHVDTLLLGGPNDARTALAAWATANGGALPDYDLGEQANAFRGEVRAWFEKHWAGPRQAAHEALPLREQGYDKDLSRALGAEGWVGLSWPISEGGQARSSLERLAFAEEAANFDAPLSAHSAAATLIGPTLMTFAGDALKAEVLPRILRGEVTACLGYSEPEAGSDLAALRTRAERTEDGWVINGQKLWTTYAEKADYVLLATRTNPEAKKHQGITIFFVPMETPGVDVRPSLALYGRTFCTVFYDNVRVPDTARIGAVDGGWTVLTSALADERILMGGSIMQARLLLSRLMMQLGDTGASTQAALGALLADVEVARQLLMRGVIAEPAAPHHAAMTKVFSSELMQRLGETALELLGPSALLSKDAEGAVLDGAFEQFLRYSIMHIIGGGTNEIQRTLIAQRGLGLPR